MCGHDGHMAMLLGGARLLHDAETSLKVHLTVQTDTTRLFAMFD